MSIGNNNNSESSCGLHNPATRRVVAASFAGALLEWYDFFIFGTAAGLIFGPLFFPQEDPVVGTIAAFATFGVGFLARPFGGIVFGHYGDKIGRKVTLIWTLMIVGISTFLIGLLPTYASAGVWAPVLLVILRLVQGFGLGGEYGGAALMTIESAPQNQRGFLGSLPQTAASAGIMLATGVFALCNWGLTQEQFMSWGWRVPFLLSVVMLGIGMYIRVHTEETGDFKHAKQEAIAERQSLLTVPIADRDPNKLHKKNVFPIIQLFKQHPKNIFLALGARLAETVSSNIINAFGIAYLSTQLTMERQIPLTGMLIASAIGLITCPLFGWLSDRTGQRLLYIIGAAFCILFAFPFFFLLKMQDPIIICLAIIIGYNLGSTMMFAVQPTLFTRMFGTKVRYTGLSFAYQFSAILGGMTPLIASSLLALGDGEPWYVATYLCVISIVSLICVLLIKENNNIMNLER